MAGQPPPLRCLLMLLCSKEHSNTSPRKSRGRLFLSLVLEVINPTKPQWSPIQRWATAGNLHAIGSVALDPLRVAANFQRWTATDLRHLRGRVREHARYLRAQGSDGSDCDNDDHRQHD